MLAITAKLVGAKKVIAIDIDKDALEIAKENINICEVEDIELIEMDIKNFLEECKLNNKIFDTGNKSF